MKKSTVVKLYNELDNKEILKKGLPRMINVKGDAEDIFYDLCIKYNDILNSDILDHFISISTFSSSLDDNLERKKLLNGIYNILDNDYLVSNMDFNIILENIEYIMGTMFSKVFDVYDEEEEKFAMQEKFAKYSKEQLDAVYETLTACPTEEATIMHERMINEQMKKEASELKGFVPSFKMEEEELTSAVN